MIEIIVINRIGDTEFRGLFPNEEDGPIEQISPDRSKRLRIYNGLRFPSVSNQIAERIAGYVPDDCLEALIVIHSSKFVDIAEKLLAIANGRLWVVKRYTTDDDTYCQVESCLVNDIDSHVDDVYNLFAPDRTYEAKLDLLHDCLAPDGEVELPEKLSEYASAWREFIEAVYPEVKEGEQCGGKDQPGVEAQSRFIGNSKLQPVDDPLSEDYVKALTKLRDALFDD